MNEIDRALSLASQGQLTEAEKILLDILTNNPANSQVLLALGQIYFYRGEHKQARQFLHEAIRHDPGNIQAFSACEYYERKKSERLLISVILLGGVILFAGILFSLMLMFRWQSTQKKILNDFISSYEAKELLNTDSFNMRMSDLENRFDRINHAIRQFQSSAYRDNRRLHENIQTHIRENHTIILHMSNRIEILTGQITN